MTTTFERTWQMSQNNTTDATSSINSFKNAVWLFKSFLKGDLALFNSSAAAVTTYGGLWTCYYSCDGLTAGTAGDGYDRWGVQGSTTANSGSAASLVTGATITGAIRITGVTGLGSSLGNYLTISGAATTNNNSPTQTPFKIVKVNSATDVEIWNPLGVTGDANNGAIVWAERTAYTVPTFGGVATGTLSAAGPIQYSATTHSWMVLKSPPILGPYYLIIDLFSATTGNIYVAFCKTAPTGGTTSARPTSVDEVQLANWQNAQFVNNATGARFHGGLSVDGYWWIAGSTDGAGYRSFGMFQPLAESKATDSYPAYMYFSGGATLPTLGQINSATYGGMRSRNGSIALFAYGCQHSYATNVTGLFNAMNLTDFTDSLYDDLPIYIYVQTAGYKSIRGRIIDIRHSPNNGAALTGLVESSISNPVSTIIGSLWVPCYTVPII